ncbi:unnamed protein product [Protopolystoma xenopodis]|uniref:Uncharacterized protein n=1 Tax=Protopolystoma xenopodis TaxID=117903 RepID=A0A448XPF3_9PLAT|nr:unnamed protein product [Protopolystoma xenopodis]
MNRPQLCRREGCLLKGGLMCSLLFPPALVTAPHSPLSHPITGIKAIIPANCRSDCFSPSYLDSVRLCHSACTKPDLRMSTNAHLSRLKVDIIK